MQKRRAGQSPAPTHVYRERIHTHPGGQSRPPLHLPIAVHNTNRRERIALPPVTFPITAAPQ